MANRWKVAVTLQSILFLFEYLFWQVHKISNFAVLHDFFVSAGHALGFAQRVTAANQPKRVLPECSN